MQTFRIVGIVPRGAAVGSFLSLLAKFAPNGRHNLTQIAPTTAVLRLDANGATKPHQA